MVRLSCEMCNGTDIIKQDGVYVCQHCGMKYSVEEARKLMIEGTVEVTGTVKIDNSDFINKYTINARRAKEKTDWEEVEKYYNMVEQNDPQNIEAVFYSSYGKAMLSLTDNEKYKREQKFNVFGKSISVIDDYYDVSKSKELKPIIIGMSEDIVKMSNASFVYNTTTDQNGIKTDDRSFTYTIFARTEIQFVESIENIIKKDEQTYLYYILIKHYKRCIKNARVASSTAKAYGERMQKVAARLHELDPSYTPEEVPSHPGCYVASAVYGSYDCPQVWTLRRYRDHELDKTRRGRLFIKTYYAVSPTIVKYFGDNKLFKNFWKKKLDKMVCDLQKRGYDSTEYNDKY